ENLQIYHERYRFDSIPWSKIDFIAMIDNRLNFFSLEGIPFEEDYNTGIPKDFKAHIVIGRNLSLKSFLQSHPESKHIRFKENLAFNYEKLKRISKGKCLCQDPDRKRYELILDEWSDKPCSEKKQLYNSLFNDSEGRDVLGNYICTSNGDLAKILYSYFDDEDLGLELLKEKDYKRYSKIMNCLQDCLNEDFKQGEKLSCDCK
ncbi:MAG: hypothetical protein KDD63_23615, partial [Bacteroidetes bacterium]|nr:hypothetical protein [Bacteroidota bacterium]